MNTNEAKRKMSARMLIIAVAICGTAGIFAISRAASPAETVKTFHTALGNGDMATAGKNCTPETMEMVAMFGQKIQAHVQGVGKITSAKEEIDGDEAEVEVTYENGGSDTYELVKVNGKWRVHEEMKSGK
jgi:hypothetical protein